VLSHTGLGYYPGVLGALTAGRRRELVRGFLEDQTEAKHTFMALRLRLILPLGELELLTEGVSEDGFRARLEDAPPVGEEIACAIYLPDQTAVEGVCSCRSRHADSVVEFSFTPARDSAVFWEIFVGQQNDSDDVLRLLARYASTVDRDPNAMRSVVAEGNTGALVHKAGSASEDKGAAPGERARVSGTMRLYSSGESGEAYRILFGRHPSEPALECDLVERLPGFKVMAKQFLDRVLCERILVRTDDLAPLTPVRPIQTKRGDYSFVKREDNGISLESLGVGEKILVEVDGSSVFPHFTAEELQRIACDVGEWDVAPTEPGLVPVELSEEQRAALERHVKIDALQSAGDASRPSGEPELRAAQDAAAVVQVRDIGGRQVRLFTQVWAEVMDAHGDARRGPTVRDGEEICVLALRGPGTPCVVRLAESSHVTVVEPPSKER